MSDSRYSYDETTEIWPYFVITLATVVTVPMTISAIIRITTSDSDAKAYKTSYVPETGSHIAKFKARSKRSKLFTKLYVFNISVS